MMRWARRILVSSAASGVDNGTPTGFGSKGVPHFLSHATIPDPCAAAPGEPSCGIESRLRRLSRALGRHGAFSMTLSFYTKIGKASTRGISLGAQGSITNISIPWRGYTCIRASEVDRRPLGLNPAPRGHSVAGGFYPHAGIPRG